MADAEPVPALTASVPLPIAPAAPPGTRHGRLGSLFNPLRSLLRRPGRALAVLALLCLLVVAGGAAGVFLWFGYHLRAARAAVTLGHNLAAIDHLNCCRRVSPDHPETLLLCATAARRAGNWAEAEELLNSYWRQ